MDDLKAGIKKLVKLLRLGGYITILFVEDQTYYYIGEEKWALLPISLAQVKKLWRRQGALY